MSTPLDPNVKLVKEDHYSTPVDPTHYQSLVGSLLYAAMATRPDIAHAVGVLGRFSASPNESHMTAAKRVCRYLKRTIDLKLEYTGQCTCETFGYSDADWASSLDNRHSTSGNVFMIAGAAVSWLSKRQATVETSTYGSELVAARVATELIMEVRYMLRMLGVPVDGPALMLGDNMSIVLNTSMPSSVLKKKHCAIGYHRVREAIAAKVLRFAHIKSVLNPADCLTKPLAHQKFHDLVKPIVFRAPKHISNSKEGKS